MGRSAQVLLAACVTWSAVGYPIAAGAQTAAPTTAPLPAPPAAVETKRLLLVHEPYFTSGAGFYGSLRRVLAGAGGGLGYRLNIGRFLALYGEGRALVYTDKVLTGAGGVALRLPLAGSWEPLIGVQIALFTGQRIELLAGDDTRFGPAVVWAAQARLNPLRFAKKTFTASALAFDWGYGVDAGRLGTAFSITVLDIGLRF